MLNTASTNTGYKFNLLNNKHNMYNLLKFTTQPFTKKPFLQSMEQHLKGIIIGSQNQQLTMTALNFQENFQFQQKNQQQENQKGQNGGNEGGLMLNRFMQGGVQSENFGGSVGDEGDQVQYDVIGLGEAIIDFSAMVDDSILEKFQVEKGGRRVFSVEERQEVLDVLTKCKADIEVNAGGSVANTLVGISQLSRSYAQRYAGTPLGIPLNVAFAGRIGDDAHGMFFERSLSRQGVYNLTTPAASTTTGMVIVLTSKDAQRTFLAFPGNCQFKVDAATRNRIANSQMMIIEGYLLEQQNALEELIDVVQFANQQGVRVVLGAGDAGLVARNRAAFQRLVSVGVDAFLGNVNEGNAYFDTQNLTGEELSLRLASCCPIAVITDGQEGSYIGALGQVHKIDPYWLNNPPVDTTGAGDAYAAGVLFALSQNFTLEEMGMLGSRLASEVIMDTSSRTDQDKVDKVLTDFQNMQEMLVSERRAYI